MLQQHWAQTGDYGSNLRALQHRLSSFKRSFWQSYTCMQETFLLAPSDGETTVNPDASTLEMMTHSD